MSADESFKALVNIYVPEAEFQKLTGCSVGSQQGLILPLETAMKADELAKKILIHTLSSANLPFDDIDLTHQQGVYRDW